MQFIIRMRDGSSLYLLRESNKAPVIVNVILPREREEKPFRGHYLQRGKFNPEDEPWRFNAIDGLLKDARSPLERVLELIREDGVKQPVSCF